MMSGDIEKIEVPTWWVPGGGMMYRRDCLPSDHPESEYNYIKKTYNVRPEEYGVFHEDNETES